MCRSSQHDTAACCRQSAVIPKILERGPHDGRFIPPDVRQKGSDGAPRTYEILKEKGSANGFAMIDNSPGSANPAASSKTTPAFSRQLYPNLLTLDEMEAVEARHEDEMFARISARRMAKNTPE